jgi:hypothetical protein
LQVASEHPRDVGARDDGLRPRVDARVHHRTGDRRYAVGPALEYRLRTHRRLRRNDSMELSRRRTLAAIGGTVIGTGLSGTASGQVDYHPKTDPLSLTDENQGQLIAAIPNDVKRQLGRAKLFAPLSVLESQQNTDEPTPGENGLVTFTPVRRRGDVVDLEYTYVVDDAPDLDELTQGHIHHAPRGASDNRLFFALYAFSDLDGSDGDPVDPPISVGSTLSEQLEEVLSRDFDNTFRQEDPEVPEFDDEFVSDLSSDMLETPREYTVNAHTTTFRSEAIRGQVRPAVLGRLSRRELVETVLATAGLEAL